MPNKAYTQFICTQVLIIQFDMDTFIFCLNGKTIHDKSFLLYVSFSLKNVIEFFLL